MNKTPRIDQVLSGLAARFWPVAGALLLATGGVHAGTVPLNLSASLGELVITSIVTKDPDSLLARQRRAALATEPEMLTISTEGALMRDAAGRVLVNVIVDGQSNYNAVRAAVSGLPGITISAEDRTYRSGVIEGYVPVDTLVGLAKTAGVSAVHAVNRPITNVGSVTQQGVVQHRVNQLPANIDGSGITIGILSDSYNNSAATIKAPADVLSCDLPGTANPCGNTLPVEVLDELVGTNGIDEGRAMAQLVHDMAPKARLGVASAFNGDVSFANNIRALAGVPGMPNTRPGFAAQIIVDDVQYFNEGMFADTIIAQAVDDVTALGVSYFSSAGNTPPTQGYASDFRQVPVGPTATANTNISLAGVPANLYAGGFHNFRSDGGQDIAQTITLGSVTGRQLRMTLQWDDPYDVTPTTIGALVGQVTGTLSAATPSVDATFALTAGAQYQIDVRGDSITGGAGNLDVIVAVILPDGSTLTTVDTGNGETLTFFAPQSGNYIIRVTGFNSDRGPFTVKVNVGNGVSKMTTDFNLLFFRSDTGAYLGCVCENNLATNRPVELPGSITFPTTVTTGQVQLVISRGNIPTAPVPASRLRYKMISSTNGTTGFPAEYFSYTTPITYGHNSAAGANGVAAYSPFKPAVPEDFSATGPVRIVWDRNNNRIPDDQQVRLKPNLAAMDGGNTTFFTSDTNRDLDTFPNFFGTSAAAPTAASIAALVLQAKGGPGSLTPTQMRNILQNSTFPHDLDPYSSSSLTQALPNRGKVSVTLVGDNSISGRTDPNAFTIAYNGPSHITGITFNAATGNPGGGNVTVPSTPGLVFDVRAAGMPFTFSTNSVGLIASNVTPSFSIQAPAPAVTNMFFNMTLSFQPGTFTSGRVLRFGVGRSTFRSAFAPPAGDSRAANSADVAGQNVLIPEGTVAPGGITYSGTLADGSTFSGTLTNRYGRGYSGLDGFGFIDAVRAINSP